MAESDTFRKEVNLLQLHEELLTPLRKPGGGYWILLLLSFSLVALGGFIWSRLINTGLGLWGLNRPAGWGIDITTFVFWVGITHSGTLMSAIFYLLGAPWRASISRIAEAMTVFAIMTAGLFPIIHLGRSWLFYWLIPYPNERGLWVNFRSPLIWDLFAVGTYFTVSLLFWYMGMVPDLAAMRDRSSGSKRTLYGLFALGWNGSGEQWRHFRAAYLLLASLVIPLAVSVHSVVSWDFAMSLVPGWHSTIFAPYFVVGAIFSGLAMICALAIPLRPALKLETYITSEHFDKLGKLLLFMSLLMTYAYANEFFIAWYAGDPVERASLYYRAFGSYRALFWIMAACNSFIPLLLFSKSVRCNGKLLFTISVFVLAGMYLERFIITPVSLTHDFVPYVWHLYSPTIYEYGILAGSFGFFFFWFLLFVRFLPVVPIFEIKELRRSGLVGGSQEASR
jgi:molybdopterin-containing oxidoreductase family membrane subunit